MPCQEAIQMAMIAASVGGMSAREIAAVRPCDDAERAAPCGFRQAKASVGEQGDGDSGDRGSGRQEARRKAGERTRQRRNGRAVGGDHRDAAEVEHAGERHDEG